MKIALTMGICVIYFTSCGTMKGQDDFERIINQVKMHESAYGGFMIQQRQRQRNLNQAYRRVSGDQTSTDAQIEAQLSRLSRAYNPQAYAELHRQTMSAKRANFQSSQEGWSSYQRGVKKRIDKSNQLASATNKWVANRFTEHLRGEQRYINPESRTLATLPYFQPNSIWKNSSGSLFYQNNLGQYHSVIPGHHPSQLNVYRGW